MQVRPCSLPYNTALPPLTPPQAQAPEGMEELEALATVAWQPSSAKDGPCQEAVLLGLLGRCPPVDKCSRCVPGPLHLLTRTPSPVT